MNTSTTLMNTTALMLKLDYSKDDVSIEDIADILVDNDLEIAKSIVGNIMMAIDEGMQSVIVCEVIFAEPPLVSLQANKDNFLFTLQENMDKLIGYEEYELCGKMQKYIDELSK